MASTLERLAARLANDEPVPRRTLFSGRTRQAAVPARTYARAPVHRPTPPARADYLALQKAVLTSEAQLRAQVAALVHTLNTPSADGTFSASTKAAIDRLVNTTAELLGRVENVAASAVQSSTENAVGDLVLLLGDLQQLGASSDPRAAKAKLAKVERLAHRSRVAWGNAAPALNLSHPAS
jgi:hypothetical protein